jgi:hypothetical protein
LSSGLTLGVGDHLVAELHASDLGRLQPGGGALTDHSPLLLGQGRVDVQGERVDVAAERSDDERHPLRHQTGDERHVSRQAIELGDRHWRLEPLRRLQGRVQLRPAVQRVAALARLDLGELGDDIEALRGGEGGNGGALGLEAQAGPTLLLGGHAMIGNDGMHNDLD